MNFIGQDLAALGTNWTAETEFTVKYTGGWQNTGLVIWNGDNNFVRSSITHSLTAGNLYVEQSKDNPTSTEGARVQAGGNITIRRTTTQAVTIRMRYGARQRVQHRHRAVPGHGSGQRRDGRLGQLRRHRRASWTSTRPAARAVTRRARASASSPRRTSRAPPARYAYAGTPGTVDVNYFRVTPDPFTCETDAPTTTATLDPAAPATGDTYDRRGQGQPVRDRHRHQRRRRREDRVPHHHQRHGGRLEDAEQQRRRQPVRERGQRSRSSGTHLVEFRSTDKAANVEATKSVTFKVQLPVCDRSDEFDGTDILPRWVRHTRNGGTPTTGPLAPTVSGGQLHLPTNDLEIDAADAKTSVGPINFLGQDLPALGTHWTAETQFTVQLRRAVGRTWAWSSGTGTTTSSAPRSPTTSAPRRSSSSSPRTTRARPKVRAPAARARTILPTNTGPVTIKMRYTRAASANTVTAQYQIVAPASAATADWVNFPTITGWPGPEPEQRRPS